MFNNDLWQAGPGKGRSWRLGLPLAAVAAVALVWLLQYGSLLSALVQWFWEGEGDTTLVLPEDLVVARLPWSLSWNPDRATDGVLIALPDKGDPTGQTVVIERWSRPWIEGNREPIPTVWRIATQPDWRNDTALVCHFGLNSPVTRDHSLLAAMYHPSERAPQTRIVALPEGKELARLDEIPAGANGKCIAWHPREDVLAIGGYGSITLAAGPDWKARTLATAARDRSEWEMRVQEGNEETGYYPNENVSQLLFSDDGELLITAMDRGVRVYDWQEVGSAIVRLPAPRVAVDGMLVRSPLFSFKMTFSVAFDPQRRLVLWSENDGKLKFLNLTTNQKGTLLALPNRYCVSRVHLCARGDALICELVRIGRSDPGQATLAVLDYLKLLQRGGAATAHPGNIAGEDG